MLKAPEDMTLDDFNLIVDGMACRSLASPFTCQAPQGIFHHLNFPMTEADSVDCNPSVHYLDVVKNYNLDITIEDRAGEKVQGRHPQQRLAAPSCAFRSS